MDLLAFMQPRLAAGLACSRYGATAGRWPCSFTPSYVQAGSASAIIRDSHGERHIAAAACNGYEGEWRELHDVVSGAAGPRYPLTDLVDDLTFAIDIADGAASAVLGGGAR